MGPRRTRLKPRPGTPGRRERRRNMPKAILQRNAGNAAFWGFGTKAS
jgi:hypothetical protein